MIVIITGTNTDVGKTVATAAIASVLRERGCEVLAVKPIQTGEPAGRGDAQTIERLAGVPTLDHLRYPEPLAPNLSARRAGMAQARLDDVADFLLALDAPQRTVLVEGAGGLLVRLADDWTLADLAAKLEAPVLVVTSTGLGSLNLAELTVEAARSRGLEVIGLVGGSIEDPDDLATRLNLSELPAVTGVPLLGVLPVGAGDLPCGEFAQVARSLDWPDQL
ncbi:dethiobiotin synthase [Luteococcus sp. Sow4_B9]|uniref:dethiobiotin synthase n=1 Tax=Luteococcus sp. Sow4_B9 TaxID=3438792 RepID=UPI003F99D2D5